MSDVPRKLSEQLAAFGQDHLLENWGRLTDASRAELIGQLESIDFATIRSLYADRAKAQTALPPRESIASIPVHPKDASPEIRALGEAALRRGEVAVLLVAGGQGSRLGFDKPKGMFPVTPVTGGSLFQVHAEKVLAVSRRYGKPVPLLVMTSPATHDDTVEYFQEMNHFGLSKSDVFFFQQGMMPAVEIATGRLLMEAPGQLFLSPNGHGGTITALAERGILDVLESRAIRHVFYFQVDNPLVKVCDPDFLGNHVAAASEASSKVVFKEQPGEKVGVFAKVDSRCAIIEYSDIPAEMAAEREDDGTLRFRAGNPAIHLFDVGFLRRVTGSGGMTYHIARKKVAHHDPLTGEDVRPDVENALKFELFIFDALPLARSWVVMETTRAEEFAPLKNATGPDSPETVAKALTQVHAEWLEKAGAAIDRTPEGDPVHAVEISPLFALDAEECRAKLTPGLRITEPTHLR